MSEEKLEKCPYCDSFLREDGFFFSCGTRPTQLDHQANLCSERETTKEAVDALEKVAFSLGLKEWWDCNPDKPFKDLGGGIIGKDQRFDCEINFPTILLAIPNNFQ